MNEDQNQTQKLNEIKLWGTRLKKNNNKKTTIKITMTKLNKINLRE